MADILLNLVTPKLANRKKITLENIPQNQESQLYTLMCLKSVFMLRKFTDEWGDAGRKLLIDVKYRLSNCPLTYLMIRDMVKETSIWEITPCDVSNMRFRIEDKKNDVSFTLFNHSRGIDRGYYREDNAKFSKYDPERIKLYYNSEHEMFNDNEIVVVAKVLATYKVMLENHKELKRQQKMMESSETLRGLY